MYEAAQQEQREKLVTDHADLVKRIAYHLISRLPPSVQIEDLIQAGTVGLLVGVVVSIAWHWTEACLERSRSFE